MALRLYRAEKLERFDHIMIGSPFFAYEKWWVKINEDEGTVLHDTMCVAGPTCTFKQEEVIECVVSQNSEQ